MGLDPYSLIVPKSRVGATLANGSGRLAAPVTEVVVGRRRFLAGAFSLAASLALVACAGGEEGDAAGGTATPPNPVGATVPPGTELKITGPQNKLQLQLAGLLDTLPFRVPDWPNLTAGPDVINAFRAGGADLAGNAGIPPIQAHFQGGVDARIVAVRLTRVPTYVFATKPGSDIQTVADFKGKRVAFSQGQAQGVVLLRALKEAGIKRSEVTLVELTSTQFLTALQAGQVDIAPIGVTQIYQYLNQYGKDGAHPIQTDVIDRLSILWAPGKVLDNPSKVAAIAAFIPVWARGAVWQHEHPDVWIQKYYVEDQGISATQGKAVVDASSKPLFPPTWDEAIRWEQETIDLLSEGDFVKSFDANILFDRRFEGLASSAVSEEYRS